MNNVKTAEKSELNKKLERLFDNYDTDKNGSLDKNEMIRLVYAIYAVIGIEKSPVELMKMALGLIEEMDLDKNSAISKGK